MATRAQHAVQNEAHLLAIRIEQTLRDELNAAGWLCVRNLAERMMAIADRGMYHAAVSPERMAALAALTAGRVASEPEAR